MNEKSCFNEAMFVFTVQSCCWKILIFLIQALESGTHVRPKPGSSINHGCQIEANNKQKEDNSAL